jgi:hypothetical protein
MKDRPVEDEAFPFYFLLEKGKDLDLQDQPFGLKEIETQRAVLYSQVFKRNPYPTP